MKLEDVILNLVEAYETSDVEVLARNLAGLHVFAEELKMLREGLDLLDLEEDSLETLATGLQAIGEWLLNEEFVGQVAGGLSTT